MTTALCLTAILFLVVVAARPALAAKGGRLLGMLVIIVLPLAAVGIGATVHMEKATETKFCLSCHPMEKYGKSLHVDDVSHLASSHFLNGRVPQDHACYSCHTDYTMFGGLKSKVRGLRHVWIQYLGTVPDKIHLYTPYNNRECLHCHEGTRPFLEGSTHNGDDVGLAKIRSNEISCVKSGCHNVVHDVDNLAKLQFWPKEEAK
jgi:cytochrome c-type protein NapC